jgi:hypothetical protein
MFFTLLPYDTVQSGGTAEDCGTAWQRLAVPVLGLGPTSDGPLSWPLGLGAAESPMFGVGN